jgi:NAD(P)H-flavin reductase
VAWSGATIKEKRQVAKGTLFVTFDLQGEEVDLKPGHYFFVTLPRWPSSGRCSG